MIRRFLAPAFLGPLLLWTSASAAQQADFPLSVWPQHKQITQIPWTVYISKPAWRADLRQELRIGVLLRSIDLNKTSGIENLILFARASEEGKPISLVHSAQTKPREPDPRLPRSAGTVIRVSLSSLAMAAIVRPGKYKLELALLDKGTGRFNTRFEDVSIPDDERNPVLRASRESPKFEFVPMSPPEPPDPSSGGLPFPFPFPSPVAILRGGPLRLPIMATNDGGFPADPPPPFVIGKPRATHLSVISILSPPVAALSDPSLVTLFQRNLLYLLPVFMRFQVTRGEARFIGLDLTDRSRVFNLTKLEDVTVDELKKAINEDVTTVSLEDLSGRSENGRFVRSVLNERLQFAENDNSGDEHVIIVVGARSVFPGSENLAPLVPAKDCHCRVFYVRFPLFVLDHQDDVEKLLKAYKPRVFEPLNWDEFRKDFSQIYDQLLR